MGSRAVTTDVFGAISDPQRRRILDMLRAGELPVGDLVLPLGITMSAVSQHLRVLRECGLVRQRKRGRQRLYRVNPRPLKKVVDWTEPYAPFWTDRLDRLGRYLDDER